MKNNYIVYPEENKYNRTFLINKGKNNLLVIGLYPGLEDDDENIQTIDTIAQANGYDGWVIANLTTDRAESFAFLGNNASENQIIENAELIMLLVSKKQIEIHNVLLAWGDGISSHYNTQIFRNSAQYIFSRLAVEDVKFWCIGITPNGHPFHPTGEGSYKYLGLPEEIVLQPIEIKGYAKNLKLKSI